MSLDLPEGWSLNSEKEDLLEVLLPFYVVNEWKCPDCELSLDCIIVGENGRFSGSVRATKSNVELWNGKLPKNEQKAIDFLKTNFDQKVTNHRSRH